MPRRKKRTMTIINMDLLRIIDIELRAAAEAIAAKHGLTVKLSGGKFSPDNYKPGLEFMSPGETEGGFAKVEEMFRLYASLYGLKPEMLGKTFTIRGDTYRVIGASPGRSKNSIIIMRLSDGSRRVCPPATVLAGKFL